MILPVAIAAMIMGSLGPPSGRQLMPLWHLSQAAALAVSSWIFFQTLPFFPALLVTLWIPSTVGIRRLWEMDGKMGKGNRDATAGPGDPR